MQFGRPIIWLSDNDLSRAEPENDSGAILEVMLPVSCIVREFRQEVYGLNGANALLPAKLVPKMTSALPISSCVSSL